MKQDVAKVVLIVGPVHEVWPKPELVFFADSVFTAALAERLAEFAPDGWSIRRNRVRGRVQRQDAAFILHSESPKLRRGSSWRLARLELHFDEKSARSDVQKRKWPWSFDQHLARVFLDTAFDVGARVEMRRPYEYWLLESGTWRWADFVLESANNALVRQTPASPVISVVGRCDALEVVRHVQLRGVP